MPKQFSDSDTDAMLPNPLVKKVLVPQNNFLVLTRSNTGSDCFLHLSG